MVPPGCYGFVTRAIIANGYKIVKFSGKHLSEHSIDQLLRSLFFRIFTGLLRHFIILRLCVISRAVSFCFSDIRLSFSSSSKNCSFSFFFHLFIFRNVTSSSKSISPTAAARSSSDQEYIICITTSIVHYLFLVLFNPRHSSAAS